MSELFSLIDAINGITLSKPVLITLLGIGVLFTVWSGFSQYRSLTHGVGLLSGKWTSGEGPGVLSHFQALSAALSATVGLGNIAGVAIAVEIGGPGAVFWMWVVGLAGMAIKSTEVLLSMLYRNTDDPENPHGGTMWVAKKGLAELSPRLAGVGSFIGALFAIPLILFAFTGGNMFQAWSVGDTTREYFGIAPWITGLILALVVGMVIIGGIKRIGQIAATLVPFMCVIYIIAGLCVLVVNAEQIPAIFALIFKSAFAPAEATGAFVGAGLGTAFMFGMKRALFSSEAGMGSAPIAHSAVKTREPATEGIVAGLEPFIDTLVVCTITALVILSSGIWQRGPSAEWSAPVNISQAAEGWVVNTTQPPAGYNWQAGDTVFAVVETDATAATGERRQRLHGQIVEDGASLIIDWRPLAAADRPKLMDNGLYVDYTASTLTAKAFDSAFTGLGQWMVTLAIWLFAISTMITWSYYGEQGVIYLTGERAVMPYRLIYCSLILVSCLGFIQTAYELDAISTIGMGFMLLINLFLMLLLGHKAMAAYKDYVARLKTGDINP
ncbi:MAG: alanine/glycine:cation symporter family protein [Nevskiales bacterium]